MPAARVNTSLPRVTVFSTGGTIASIPDGDGAAAPALTAEQLVAALPQLSGVAEVTAIPFRQVASSELTLADMIALAGEIERAVAGGADGVVITQGTDTLEETSFALDLLWGGEAPVVLTGAMRNPALPGADGPANLLGAVLLAASQVARGLGALVVFNDEVHLPLFVRKTHTAKSGDLPFPPYRPDRLDCRESTAHRAAPRGAPCHQAADGGAGDAAGGVGEGGAWG